MTSTGTQPGRARPLTSRFADLLPGVVLVAAFGLLATYLAGFSSSLSPLVVGLGLGVLIANVWPIPQRLQPGITFSSRTLLRVGVALLGFRLSVGDLLELGGAGIVVVTGVVALTFIGTRWLADRLGIGRDLGLLVATGYSICGASAIAAMDAVVEADEEEAAYAVALVTLFGTLSIVVLPLLAPVLGLAGETYGYWVGGAIHDVGQVVAAASLEGDGALEAATVVKLTRVVLLAPLVAAVAVQRRRTAASTASRDDQRRQPLIPMFVVAFLGAILIRSSGVLGDGALEVISDAEQIFLTVALVALGTGVRIASMRSVGPRPLVLGVVSWVLVATASYIGTRLVA